MAAIFYSISQIWAITNLIQMILSPYRTFYLPFKPSDCLITTFIEISMSLTLGKFEMFKHFVE